ncbi:MAG: hypothetical protein GX113_11305 [Actinobacteria bacterium]|nr:hypothetical protein [Actinomycetota bacterium]
MGEIDLGLPELLGSQWTTIALILVVVILLLLFLLLRMRDNRKRAALEKAVQAGVGGKGKKDKAPKEPKLPKAKKGRKRAVTTGGFPDAGAAMATGAGVGFLSQGTDGAPEAAWAEGPGIAPDETPGQAPGQAPGPASNEAPSPTSGEAPGPASDEAPGFGPGEAPSEVLGETAAEVSDETTASISKDKGKRRGKTAKAAAPSPYAVLTPGDLPAVDPLKSVLDSVLQGWGDLTTDDTNRLRLFRTDKVMAAIAATELPKELKNSEHARARLNQLRRYANSLQQGRRTPGGALAEFVGIGLGQTAQAQASGAEPTMGGGAAEVKEFPEEMDTTEAASGEDYLAEESAGEERAADSSWGITSTGKELWGTPAAAALWGAPETPEETPSESSTASEVEPPPAQTAWESGSGTESEETPSTLPSDGDHEATIAAAAAAFWATTDTSTEDPETTESRETVAHIEGDSPAVAETPVETPQAVEVHEEVELPVSEDVTMAEELPIVEEMTGFEELGALEPEELTKVFRATNDTTLKKSIIDTLEHKGFLNNIHEFFDDPDPEVQAHALDAADRLLGTK